MHIITYTYVYTYMYIYIYIYIHIGGVLFSMRAFCRNYRSEGRMIRLETLIELNLFDSSCSSLSSYCN